MIRSEKIAFAIAMSVPTYLRGTWSLRHTRNTAWSLVRAWRFAITPGCCGDLTVGWVARGCGGPSRTSAGAVTEVSTVPGSSEIYLPE